MCSERIKHVASSEYNEHNGLLRKGMFGKQCVEFNWVAKEWIYTRDLKLLSNEMF